jgi:hypothetical protein
LSAGKLSVTDHDRASAGLRYVYPVISRRAGGVSVGINLNPNNACNWRCLYCQVPNLTLGSAPPVDLLRLEQELRSFLQELRHGDFMASRVPEGMRRINDLALSGNGEPTSAAEFPEVIELLGRLKAEFGLAEQKLVLITNGSLIHREGVQRGLRQLAEFNGEVWFKLDRASEAGMLAINHTRTPLAQVRKRLASAIALCPTWLQTCWFALDGVPPGRGEEDDYLNFLTQLLSDGQRPQGVLLYGLARPSMQAEAARLSALPQEVLECLAARVRALGLEIRVSG